MSAALGASTLAAARSRPHEPPEARGARARRRPPAWSPRAATGALAHAALPRPARAPATPGDLLVVNTSATLPAALGARRARRRRGRRCTLADAAPRVPDDERWVVELRDAGRRAAAARPRGRAPRPRRRRARSSSLAPVRRRPAPVARAPRRCRRGRWPRYLARHGRPDPLRLRAAARWPLDAYQTVFAQRARQRRDAERRPPVHARARHARSSRAASLVAPLVAAHRRLLARARRAPVPRALRACPSTTARLVNAVARLGRPRDRRRHDRRPRARDRRRRRTARCAPAPGWTDLVVTPERGLRAVDGLLTGWHEPEASHLQLLEAVAGRRAARALATRAALAARLPLARVRRQPPHPAVTAGGARGRLQSGPWASSTRSWASASSRRPPRTASSR